MNIVTGTASNLREYIGKVHDSIPTNYSSTRLGFKEQLVAAPKLVYVITEPAASTEAQLSPQDIDFIEQVSQFDKVMVIKGHSKERQQQVKQQQEKHSQQSQQKQQQQEQQHEYYELLQYTTTHAAEILQNSKLDNTVLPSSDCPAHGTETTRAYDEPEPIEKAKPRGWSSWNAWTGKHDDNEEEDNGW